jgi:hypothetical protein
MEIRKAASLILLRLAYKNAKIKDSICDKFGFTPAG